MRRVRHRAAVLLLLAGAVWGGESCASAPPQLSPSGVAAFQARRVVKALDILRDFAIDAEAQTPKVLSTTTTRKVVTYHRSAVSTIGQVPSGWAPTVSQGLLEVQRDLPAAERARLGPYFSLVSALIAEVTR